jgi:hypothetical protein
MICTHSLHARPVATAGGRYDLRDNIRLARGLQYFRTIHLQAIIVGVYVAVDQRWDKKMSHPGALRFIPCL